MLSKAELEAIRQADEQMEVVPAKATPAQTEATVAIYKAQIATERRAELEGLTPEARRKRESNYRSCRTYYQAHQEEARAYQRKYYQEHKEQCRERHRAWVAKNREYVNAAQRLRYWDNTERENARHRKYYNDHKEEINQRRRAKRFVEKEGGDANGRRTTEEGT